MNYFKLFLIAFLLIKCHCSFSFCNQYDNLSCLRLSLKVNMEIIKLENARDIYIDYILTNCSDSQFYRIDTNVIPNFENNDYDYLNFSFQYKSTDTGSYSLYDMPPRDIQFLPDTENYILTLDPGQSYTFHIQLFKFYGLSRKGKYLICASYRVPLGNNGGYYLQLSDNYIELQVN